MSSILVVDDDPAVCLLVQHVLERRGFDVSTASDGQSGLSRFAELNPDLVIIDILMPGKEGIATILEMRETRPEARILAMTGGGSFAAGEVLRIAELIGADNGLKKPFAPTELIATVERCLAH
jgi:two-component system, chemotaxis family, chemotaxis protein CheY